LHVVYLYYTLQNIHCILDVSMASIERLHRHQIYPIVLLIKFKDRTQIKEVKDSRYMSDKISTKAAKEMFEQALKIEAEYKQFISGKRIVFLILFTCTRNIDYLWTLTLFGDIYCSFILISDVLSIYWKSHTH